MVDNFIAYFQKGGDFLKILLSKMICKQLAFFHSRTVKGDGRVQHLHMQTAFYFLNAWVD